MCRESVNDPQLATSSGGGCLIINLNQKRKLSGFNQIVFTSVINNSVSFSSFLNKLKVKINGF